jgi:uncharacterized protein (DUF2164 family)
VAIELPDETRKRLVQHIKHYFAEEQGEEIGDLRASFFLDFALETVGPSVYNQAILDAQARLQVVVGDLDLTLHEPEAGAR